MAEVSIYAILHTLGSEIMHLDEHLRELFNSYYEVFNSGLRLDKNEISEQITQLLKRERVSQSASVMVRLTASEGAKIDLSIEERSIYSGYSLRCISPKAHLVEWDTPFIEHPTSAREQATTLANIAAQRHGAQIAVRSHNGVVDLAQGAQLFAVKGMEIFTSATSRSIEHTLATECAKSLTLKFIERDVTLNDLSTLDELFFADHHGVTAISELNNHRYMSIVAEEIATLMQHKMNQPKK